jgi:hypothetical protein
VVRAREVRVEPELRDRPEALRAVELRAPEVRVPGVRAVELREVERDRLVERERGAPDAPRERVRDEVAR